METYTCLKKFSNENKSWGRGQFDPSAVVFQKMCFLDRGQNPAFLWLLINITKNHIFPDNFIKILHVVQHVTDVSIFFLYFQPTLNRFFNNCIKSYWCYISSSWNMKRERGEVKLTSPEETIFQKPSQNHEIFFLQNVSNFNRKINLLNLEYRFNCETALLQRRFTLLRHFEKMSFQTLNLLQPDH